MRSVVLITGASGGIGLEFARVFAARGHDLALVARSANKLEMLADELVSSGRPRPLVLPLDLAKAHAAEDLYDALVAAEARVAILVNNAGAGLLGPVAGLDPRDQLALIDLNIRALLDLTIRFLPDIKAAQGKILNVGSVASFMPGPGMAVYYASKHFVSALSRALSEEMKAAGVTVTTLHPGVTRTGFQARAGIRERNPARPTEVGARRVAEAGYKGLMAGRRTVVPGFGNKVAAFGLPLIPDAVLLPIVHRHQSARSG